MSENNPTAEELAEDLMEDLTDEVDVTVDELEERFNNYIEYDVNPESARQTILRNVASAQGMEVSEALSGGGDGIQKVKVEDIEEEGNFVTLEVEVTELWDNDTDSIAQVGLVHDDTGRIKFKTWDKSEKPLLTEGQSYRLEGVATDSFQNNMEVSVNSRTEVELIDESFEVPDNTESFTGTVVDVRSGSGLIRRCTEEGCTRVLDNGECAEHGSSVEGEFDLRIKAVLDNGTETQDIVVNKELTEKITGLPIQEAEQMAKDALDTDVVGEEMADRILLNYYQVEGWTSDYDDLIVQEIDESLGEDEETSVQELVDRLNSLDAGGFEQEDLTEV